ncbi:hypothetical protein D3870_21160 [Noviherbaspirillum cavernae]|uniref:EscG/YscG/SsaH family type III secretion system needle protein co-chaperone n=1 Tax=Noviherbaspirillum cavernae TaxID=2320862 RepID=A0A418WW59_9BURK|nr:hypothetical protein [Noviherbaspirillum cavernae]RJF96887.1 hypothetical protein D3870_21160 [Noviherbaspirillum cavernae]
MRRKIVRETESRELIIAIGLVWGHLNASQFEEAWQLAKACLRIWPEDRRLAMMCAYAAVELLEPLDDRMRVLLSQGGCSEWEALVLRRAEMHNEAMAE